MISSQYLFFFNHVQHKKTKTHLHKIVLSWFLSVLRVISLITKCIKNNIFEGLTYSFYILFIILLYTLLFFNVLDSEQSYECIDFTMMFVFCLSSCFGIIKMLWFSPIISDRKLNLVGISGS